MIELQVEPYCYSCPKFNAVQTTNKLCVNGQPLDWTHVITCENKEFCSFMKHYLEQYEKEGEKK